MLNPRSPLADQTTLVDDREEAQRLVEAKQAARQALVAEYSNEQLTEDDIVHVIHSVADSNNYQAAASAPVLRMLEYLESVFPPTDTGDDFTDLSIR